MGTPLPMAPLLLYQVGADILVWKSILNHPSEER